MIEKELRMEWDRVFYPEPEPDETEMDMAEEPPMDVQVAEAGPGSAAFGVFPQMKPRRAGSSELGANLPVLAADFLAAGGRGGITGSAGLVGDTLAAIRGIYEIGRRGGDESVIDAFLRGMEAGTIIPTSDDIEKWLEKYIGPVVPAGVAMEESRKKAAGAGRLVGEVVADPVAAVKVAKAVAGIAKSLTAKGAKLTPNIEVPAAGDVTKPAFRKWFGASTTVDEAGKPQVWYHGTSMNFEEFKPGVADAIYFTRSPRFAEGFTGQGPSPAIAADAEKKGWTGPNIVPVYVKAEKPFDYESADHRKMVIDFVLQKYGQKRPDGKVALFEDGKPTLYDAEVMDIGLNPDTSNWILIERKEVQDAIRSLGFDSFFVKEGNTKNLAVFKPEQVKSIFNKGTWNPKDPRIVSGIGVDNVMAEATIPASQQEPA